MNQYSTVNNCRSGYSGGAVKPELVYGLPDDITVPGQKAYSRGNTAEAAESLCLRDCKMTGKL